MMTREELAAIRERFLLSPILDSWEVTAALKLFEALAAETARADAREAALRKLMDQHGKMCFACRKICTERLSGRCKDWQFDEARFAPDADGVAV
jgi:hypothetical protein